MRYVTQDDVEPYGLRCSRCDRVLEVGDEVVEAPMGMGPLNEEMSAAAAQAGLDPSGIPVVELICGQCGGAES